MDAIRKNIEKNSQTKRNLELVKLISFLSPLLTTMRRRMMRIPDVDSMLSVVSCRCNFSLHQCDIDISDSKFYF